MACLGKIYARFNGVRALTGANLGAYGPFVVFSFPVSI